MIKVLLSGICGKMGANILELTKNDEQIKIVGGIDLNDGKVGDIPVYSCFDKVQEKPDVIIDFSSPKIIESELNYAKKVKAAVVLATTGYTAEDLQKIEKASEQIAVFRTANFSLGVNLLVKLVKQATAVLGENFDIEIIEKHHNQKVDAPSGTAIMLADGANEVLNGERDYIYGREGACGRRGNEIAMHAIRGGTIVGEHDVLFCGEDEIITLSHSARSKKVFATGAIKAAKWVANKPAGKYDMTNVLNF
ncbi:MAG: 4-hydroxy-tetrahydrodipicolinate reductase [Clostridia bacterium]|nr:4-hydroxy-tetrahydrodipicolinate reductase [Clostridia bacterium]